MPNTFSNRTVEKPGAKLAQHKPPTKHPAQINMAVSKDDRASRIIGPGGRKVDGRDEQDRRRPLRLVLRALKQEDKRVNDDDAAPIPMSLLGRPAPTPRTT